MAPRSFALVSGRDYEGVSRWLLVSLCLHCLVFYLLSRAPLSADQQTASPRLKAEIRTSTAIVQANAPSQVKATVSNAEPPPAMPREAPFPSMAIDQRQITAPRLTTEPVRISHLEDPDYFVEQEEMRGDVLGLRITVPADILPADELAALRDYHPIIRIVVNEQGLPVLVSTASSAAGEEIPAFLRRLLENGHYIPATINRFPVSSYILLEVRFKFD